MATLEQITQAITVLKNKGETDTPRAKGLAQAYRAMTQARQTKADPGLAMPDAKPVASPQPTMSPLDTMAQALKVNPFTGPLINGAEAGGHLLGLDGRGGNPMDALATMGEKTIGSIPIAGPFLHQKGEELRGSLMGITPEQAQAMDESRNQTYPEAAEMGKVLGPTAAFLIASRLPGGAKALGLEGTLGQRFGFGLSSQYGINVGDAMAHGESPQDALVHSILPTAEAAPFLLFGKGPAKAPTERDVAVASMKAEGVPLTAGQKTGSTWLKYRESELGGAKADQIMESQKEAFTQAALKRAGIDAPRATPEVVDQAFDTLGNHMDRLAALSDVPFDTRLQNELLAAADKYEKTAGSPAKAVDYLMHRTADLAAQNGGVLKGEAYQNLRSEMGELSASADGPTKIALGKFREALDDAVEHYAPPKLLEAWKITRSRYKNLLAIEDAVSKAGPDAALGLISPANLRTAVKNQGTRAYVRGKGDLNELARHGVATMTPLPNSGTAARIAARLTGPLGLAGAGGAAMAGQITPALIASGMSAAPWAVGRALLSRAGRDLPETLPRVLNSPTPQIVARSLLGG